MTRFLLSRLLGAGMVLVAMSFVVFALIGLMPGDPDDLLVTANPDATPQDIAHLRHLYGMDTPFPVRYWHWAVAALHGDLGFSRIQHRPVLEIIWPALGNTLVLTATAFVVATAISVALGTIAALRQGNWTDRLIGLLAYAGISIPAFWLGLMLIYLFAVTLHWLPAGGMPRPGEGVRGVFAHLVMPAVTLVIVEVGGPTRYVRAAMLEVLSQDYIRTARAKGISTRRMILRHALRNALIPVVTIIALGMGHLFSGALLTETIFAWPGMGRLIFESIMDNDYNLALVCLLLTTATILAANILVDIAYTKLDPRIALEGQRR
jgi:peptide/nickel transport system permease protein